MNHIQTEPTHPGWYFLFFLTLYLTTLGFLFSARSSVIVDIAFALGCVLAILGTAGWYFSRHKQILPFLGNYGLSLIMALSPSIAIGFLVLVMVFLRGLYYFIRGTHRWLAAYQVFLSLLTVGWYVFWVAYSL